MSDKEAWKDIIIEKNGITYDYSDMYQVSNLGRVRSLDRVDARGRKLKGKILNLRINKGYLSVGLSKDGKQENFSVHRLVATAFIKNPNNLPFINHRDENKQNNVWTNLEWCDNQYNTQYSWNTDNGKKRRQEMSKYRKGNFTGKENHNSKKVICLETKQVFISIKQASDWCYGSVKDNIYGRAKTAGGYHWMFLDDYKREQRLKSDINNSKLVA